MEHEEGYYATGGLLRRFDHDPLLRLISATGRESGNVYQQPSWDLNLRPQDYTATNAYTRAYSYDKIGNIQTLNHVAAGHANQNFNRVYNYGTSFADNRLESLELTSNIYFYQYDSAGNIIQEGANRYYEWTQNDKPATYSNQAGTSDPTVYTNYFYNAAGERVKKHTRKGKQVEVTFYLDGGMFETSYVKPTSGSIDNDLFYNTLHVLDGSSRIATIRVGTDADDPTSPTKYYLEDHLMDSLVVLETDGTLINREEFYPFGETSFGGYGKKRYRFNGKEKDEESGLYYYGQRCYAPWLCRFVSVDPIAEDYPQYTSYNYAGNKPITKIDLEGLQEPGAEKQGGAQTDSDIKPDHTVLINGHSEDLNRAQNNLTIAKNSKIEAINNLDQAKISNDKRAIKNSERELRKANNKVDQTERILGRVAKSFQIVENEIEKIKDANKILVYDQEIIQSLTSKDGNIRPFGIVEGQKIEPLKLLGDLKAKITIYYDDNHSRSYSKQNILVPGTNRFVGDTKNLEWRVDLSLSMGETTILNEIGDIFFKLRFSNHAELDRQKIKRESSQNFGEDNQKAYEAIYYDLFQEKFSALLQKQYVNFQR